MSAHSLLTIFSFWDIINFFFSSFVEKADCFLTLEITQTSFLLVTADHILCFLSLSVSLNVNQNHIYTAFLVVILFKHRILKIYICHSAWCILHEWSSFFLRVCKALFYTWINCVEESLQCLSRNHIQFLFYCIFFSWTLSSIILLRS